MNMTPRVTSMVLSSAGNRLPASFHKSKVYMLLQTNYIALPLFYEDFPGSSSPFYCICFGTSIVILTKLKTSFWIPHVACLWSLCVLQTFTSQQDYRVLVGLCPFQRFPNTWYRSQTAAATREGFVWFLSPA